MLVNPADLHADHARLEEIEKASIRLVTQAVFDFRQTAAEIFSNERDLPQDFGEDITREALDRMGVSRIDQRLYGKIDYKRARYVFQPSYVVRQALFVDSKAEKVSGQATATLQTAQTSMRIRHVRSGASVDEGGTLPTVIETGGAAYLTTTVFVKYNYRVRSVAGNVADDAAPAEDPVDDPAVAAVLQAPPAPGEANELVSITVAAVPNGMLQADYNPTAEDTIWRAGRNAPTLGEQFRVRLVFALLKAKRHWRVQTIPMAPAQFAWDE